MKARMVIMSAFRIILGVVVGVATILILIYLLGHLVKAVPRFSLCVLGCAIFVRGIWSAAVCLKSGYAGGGKRGGYARSDNPVGFWCNVLFRYLLAFVGIVICIAAFFISRS